jgi:hypothetical protein
MNLYRFAGVLALAGSLAACATVTRGTRQNYAIDSSPPGAAVQLTTGLSCTTPCKLKLKRKDSFTARFTKEGYEPTEVEVKSKVAGGGIGAATAGNFLAGGIIGAAVDATNGSMRTLYPENLSVTLKPAAPAAPPTTTTEAAPAATPIG